MTNSLETSPREMLKAILDHTNLVFHSAMSEIEGQDITHHGCGEAMIAGVAMLPGLVLRTISGPKSEADKQALISGLESEEILTNDLIARWFVEHRSSYPAFASYVMHLECMRNAALDILASE